MAAKAALSHTLRIALGLLMLAAGIGKALDLGGFVLVIDTYRLGLAPAMAWAAALVVTAIEGVLGGWLLTGRWVRPAAWLVAAISAGYLALQLITLWRGIALDNCGCFGVFLARPLSWWTPVEELFVIAAALALAKLRRR